MSRDQSRKTRTRTPAQLEAEAAYKREYRARTSAPFLACCQSAGVHRDGCKAVRRG